MPEQDDQAGQMDESTREFKAVVPSGDDTPELIEPGEEPFHLPPAPVAAQGAAVLGGRVSPVFDHAMGSDHFDSPVPFQAGVEFIAVVGFVPDQALGKPSCEAVMQGLIGQWPTDK